MTHSNGSYIDVNEVKYCTMYCVHAVFSTFGVRHSKFEFLFDRLESRVLGWILNTVVYGIYNFAKNQFSVLVQKRKGTQDKTWLNFIGLETERGIILDQSKGMHPIYQHMFASINNTRGKRFFSYRSPIFSRLKVGFEQHG